VRSGVRQDKGLANDMGPLQVGKARFQVAAGDAVLRQRDFLVEGYGLNRLHDPPPKQTLVQVKTRSVHRHRPRRSDTAARRRKWPVVRLSGSHKNSQVQGKACRNRRFQ
jgi:hypothetical protein